MTTEEKTKKSVPETTDSEDIDAILGVFDTNDRAHELECVDDPAAYARERETQTRKPKKQAEPVYIGPATIKRAKRIACMIVFWICIASSITTTASIVLSSWMIFKPEGLLFTIIMVIIGMVITMLYAYLYNYIKDSINTSC